MQLREYWELYLMTARSATSFSNNRETGVHYSYYVKSTSLLSETALRTPQTLLAKILDT